MMPDFEREAMYNMLLKDQKRENEEAKYNEHGFRRF